jgi:hypothetical protein
MCLVFHRDAKSGKAATMPRHRSTPLFAYLLTVSLCASAWAQGSDTSAADDLYAPIERDAPASEAAPMAPVEPASVAPAEPAPGGDDLYGDVVREDAPAQAPAAPAAAAEASRGATMSLDLGVTELQLQFGGGVQSYLMYRVEKKTAGNYYNRQVLADGFVRNENTLTMTLNAQAGDFGAVVDVDADWLAYAESVGTLNDLTHHERIDPVRFEAQSLYVEAVDFVIDGLDLRIGQQVIAWGVGDQFNPTNTLNPKDLDNVLLFGKQIGNFMVRADYAITDTWGLNLVVVPLFKPAVLPATAPLALTNPNRLPFYEEALRYRLHSEKILASSLGVPTVVRSVAVQLPRQDITNVQAELRVAGSLLDQDVALSYYFGRADFPQPVYNYAGVDNSVICDPAEPSRCTKGLLATDVTLAYPRVHVIGLNLTGELPLSFISQRAQPLGYRFELGFYIPHRATRMRIEQGAISIGGVINQAAGEYAYALGGQRPIVVPDTPFAKWVLGLDYSIGGIPYTNLYINAMWVHGMVDEFGAGDFFTPGWSVRDGSAVASGPALAACSNNQDGSRCASEVLRPRLGDYLVLGVDLKFANDVVLLRLFTIWDMTGIYFERPDPASFGRIRTYSPFTTPEGFSAVLYPELDVNIGHGLVLACGALFQLGRDYTKFGEPAAGGSLVWTRAQFRY